MANSCDFSKGGSKNAGDKTVGPSDMLPRSRNFSCPFMSMFIYRHTKHRKHNFYCTNG